MSVRRAQGAHTDMSTNSDYFTDALRAVGVLSEIESPSAEHGATMLRVLNAMLNSWRGDGIDLGIPPQSATTDTIWPPEDYEEAFKYNLALRAANEFEVEVPILVATFAEAGYQRMLRDAIYNDLQSRDFDHTPFRTGGRYNINTDT